MILNTLRKHFRVPIAGFSALLCSVLATTGAATAQQYGRRILAQPDRSPRLASALSDLQSTLQAMTGVDFTLAPLEDEPLDVPGIGIATTRSGLLPETLERRLANHGPEAFLLVSEGPDRLWIAAGEEAGLSHGIYAYLDRLGARWVFPNPNWEFIPERTDISVTDDRLVEPAFAMRTFFGTGGFGPRNPVDPKLEMADRWRRWQQRNRFGGSLRTYGHVGHGFSIRHENALREHPEYRAEVKGERVPYRPGIKFCASNPEVLDLFVQDRITQLRKQLQQDPDSPASHYVGVGPADGHGFCECADCRAIGSGSLSDQVFHVANVVARAIAREFPGKDCGVGIYAYSVYADLPSIPLEPNMQICIIPNAFQSTGLPGDALLRKWLERIDAEKIRGASSIYDYWNITDWGKNLPGFDFRTVPRDKIRFWHRLGLDGIHLESTYSAGAIGLAHYLGARLMWDPATDVDALLEEFYSLAFGQAAPPMRRMLNRWADEFILSKQELALSFRDLNEAYALADAREIEARIGDFAGYVQYLRKRYEFQSASMGDSPAKCEKARDLTRLIWSIYPSAMVQTYRLGQLLHHRSAKNCGVLEYLDPTDGETPGWSDVAAPTAADLRQWVAEGIQAYSPLGFEPRSFKGPLVALGAAAAPSGEFTGAYSSIYTTTFHFQVPAGMQTLPVRLMPRNWHEGQAVRVTAFDPEGKKVFEQACKALSRPADAQWHRLDIPADRPGLYRVEVFDQKNGFTLEAPAGVPMGFAPFRPLGWVRAYFHVPEGLEKLAIYNPPRNVSATLYDPDGEAIELKPADGPLYVIDVPEGKDGRAWSLRRPGGGPVKLLNAPSVFSLSPEAMLIPEDAR